PKDGGMDANLVANEAPPNWTGDGAKLERAVAQVKTMESNAIDVRDFPKIGDKELTLLRDVPELQSLNLDKTAVTDEGMREVAALGKLRVLSLTGTQVTAKGIATLKNLTCLEELRHDKLRFDDAGAAHLKAFPNLRRLSLWKTLVGDAGMVH